MSAGPRDASPDLHGDQAATLRSWGGPHARVSRLRLPVCPAPTLPVQVIAITSGKGGVGKTALTANLAIALARQGARVLAVDGDLGMGNLDLMFGITPRRTVLDVIEGNAAIADALVPLANQITLLPACSGRFELANLTERSQYSLFSTIDTLENRFDALLIDTASGLGANAVAFAAAAEQVVLVATPDPTALADAYAFAKVLHSRRGIKRMLLVANMVKSVAEGEALYLRLASLLDRFVGVSLEYLGAVVHDYRAARAVRAAVPLLLHAPDAPASLCVEALAHKLRRQPEPQSGGIRLFWRRLLQGSARA